MWAEKVATANTLAIICLPRFYTYVGSPYEVMAGILDEMMVSEYILHGR